MRVRIAKSIVFMLLVPVVGFAQTETSRPAPGVHQTIRHRRVAVEDTDTAAPILDKAEAALDKQDFATAEPLLKQVTASDAKDFRAWYDLGFLYEATGRPDDAITAYRNVVAAKSDLFEANLHLGLVLAAKASPDSAAEAEKFLRAATQLKPESRPAANLARAWIALGRVQEAKDPAAALDSYQHAQQSDSTQASSYLLAAQLLERQSQPAAAEKQYQSALQADPASADALVALANLYMRTQRLADAQVVLRRYLVQHPEQGSAHLQLARVLAAQAAAEKDKQLASQTPKPLFAAADDAKPHSSKNTGIPPGGMPLGEPTATPAERTSQQAAAEYELAAKFGAPASFAAEQGVTYMAAGNFIAAEALYRQQIQISPKDAGLHHLLGISLLKQKRFADAQAELLIAVNLQPNLGPAFGDLATAAVENQQYELALKAMDARAKYLPELPIGFFLRATCLDHLHLRKEAAAAYRRFLETAQGQYPDQEWAARHRILALEPKQ